MPCHSGIGGTSGASADYHHHHHQGYNHHHFGGDLASYYPPAPPPPTSDLLLNGGGAAQHGTLPVSSTPPGSTHYSPPGSFHGASGGGGSLHGGPFSAEPVISEPNGLSYTNLDTLSGGVGVGAYGSNSSNSGLSHSHFSRISQYSGPQGAVTGHNSLSQCSSQQLSNSNASATSNHGSIYSQTYRDYASSSEQQQQHQQQATSSPVPPTVKSEYASGGVGASNQNGTASSALHHESSHLMSPISECSLGRTSSSSSGSAHYPNYLDHPGLLSRTRNGASAAAAAAAASVHHSMHLHQNGLASPYSVDPSSHYPDMTCNQLNGNYHHHLNHLTNHLQSPHHHSSNARSSNQNTNSNLLTTAPVPQYKWMQVKRNIPKPQGKLLFKKSVSSFASNLSLSLGGQICECADD